MHRLLSLCLALSLVAVLLTGPALADDPPAKNAQAAGATPAADPGKAASPADAPPTTDPEALRKLIEERLKSEWAVNPPTTQPAKPLIKPAAVQGPKPAPPLTAGVKPARTAQRPGTRQPPKRKKGCGPAGNPLLNLNPPPPTEPQPRWACDALVVEIEPVWAGSSAVFVFNIRNDGEGVLNIRLKGG